MDQYIGKMLDNRYEILERIGVGGMAVVYKAKCHRLNRMVALKILKSDLAQDEDFRRRFNAESQAVGQLSHPNIVSVYDVSRGGDVEYLVMELIDGITLKQYMEKRGHLNWRESLHFITQIMRGLSHAHSRGIVHRDIKPQNIMVLRDGSVKVADFGIACLENSAQTLTQQALGSVHYISPEQARGDRTDARSDIYSAGVVLYEMLTNRLPFEGDSAVSVAIQHLSSIPLAPREIDPEIPEPLELICLRAMAPDLERRYASADDMIADLESFRKNPGVSLDYTMEDLRPEVEDEPTRLLRPAVHVASPSAVGGHDRRDAPSPRRAREYEDVRPPRKRGGQTVLIVSCAAVVLVVAVLLFKGIFNSFGANASVEHTVPRVLGYTVEQAGALDGVKDVFELVIDGYQTSGEYEKDIIMTQTPEEGKAKKSDFVIHVVVSTGRDVGEMPDLLGEEARTARQKLKSLAEEYELTIDDSEELWEFSDQYTIGHVIRTVPAAGETLERGDTVTLIVSKGAEEQPAMVLPFVGSPIDVVRQQMDRLKLTVGEITERESDQPVGTVLEQSVPDNTEVPEGTKIDFVVSKGTGGAVVPPTGVDPLTEIYMVPLPTGGGIVHLAIYQDGALVADNASVDCASENYPVEVYGQAGTSSTIEVYLNDSLYRTDRITFDV